MSELWTCTLRRLAVSWNGVMAHRGQGVTSRCLCRTHTNASAHTHSKATQECPALPSPITLCQFVSAICACPSFCSHRNSSKTSQDGSPRWRCYDSRGRGGCWVTRRAVVRRFWQATRRLRVHVPTTVAIPDASSAVERDAVSDPL